jgi:palmitoyltransferase ZDHHC4
MSRWTFIVLAVLYVLIVCVVLYVYVFADPEESRIARYCTQVLPAQAWRVLEWCLGEHCDNTDANDGESNKKDESNKDIRGTSSSTNNTKSKCKRSTQILSAIEFFLDRALMLVYCAIVLGAWSIVFYFIYPWIQQQDYVSRYHQYVGYVLFVACLGSWRLASRTSPGLITKATLTQYNHYPYDHIMYEPGLVCRTRRIPRLARSKFDRHFYHENVARFDHYCGWVYNTIGQENYRFFLLFLAVHVLMCIYGSFVIGLLFYGEILQHNLLYITFFDRYTGEEITATKYIVFQYLFHKLLLEAAVWVIATVMGVALALFLAYHAWLTSRGLTTNESYKWGQVLQWYKRALREYNDAVQQGLNPVEHSNAPNSATREAIPIHPADEANETSNLTDGASRSDSADAEVIQHPGPPPVNIYNRGLLENWKEVIFPLSLRTRRATLRTQQKED